MGDINNSPNFLNLDIQTSRQRSSPYKSSFDKPDIQRLASCSSSIRPSDFCRHSHLLSGARSLLAMASTAAQSHTNKITSVGDIPASIAVDILRNIRDPVRLALIEKNSPQLVGETSELWFNIIRENIINWRRLLSEQGDSNSRLSTSDKVKRLCSYRTYKTILEKSTRVVLEANTKLRENVKRFEIEKAKHHTVIIDSIGKSHRNRITKPAHRNPAINKIQEEARRRALLVLPNVMTEDVVEFRKRRQLEIQALRGARKSHPIQQPKDTLEQEKTQPQEKAQPQEKIQQYQSQPQKQTFRAPESSIKLQVFMAKSTVASASASVSASASGTKVASESAPKVTLQPAAEVKTAEAPKIVRTMVGGKICRVVRSTVPHKTFNYGGGTRT